MYTPGSTAGLPLSVLSSFSAPPPELLDDSEALRDRIQAAVSGLLALLGIDADPLRSREHILLANILHRAWSDEQDLDLGGLIRAIQEPGFDRVGVMDMESFFPSKARFELAMTLNNLLASPGFAAWMEGEPLDIANLLHTPTGKPRIAILSIAHLSDAERMFFVTLFLNEVVAWMRSQSGTTSLRALLYMDEVFGYLPPTANPPSKRPMLTLLKQARAFGVGVVLATQNPVDLDYKALSNAGTWFLGRLQTERDKGGPLTRRQIRTLTKERKAAAPATSRPVARATTKTAPGGTRPVVPPQVPEVFVRANGGGRLVYRPALLGTARMQFARARPPVDCFEDTTVLSPLSDDSAIAPWDAAESHPGIELANEPEEGATFGELPGGAAQAKSYPKWERALKTHLYQNRTVSVRVCKKPKLSGKAGESERDFTARLRQSARELRELEEELEQLEEEFSEAADALKDSFDLDLLDVESVEIRPKKTGITVGRVALAWTPWRVADDGTAEPAFG